MVYKDYKILVYKESSENKFRGLSRTMQNYIFVEIDNNL